MFLQSFAVGEGVFCHRTSSHSTWESLRICTFLLGG